MPNVNGGAIQFFRHIDLSDLPPEIRNQISESHLVHDTSKVAIKTVKRWRSPDHPEMGVCAKTKSEARAWFSQQLGKLPARFKLERY
jgi:predicted hotdog family 3-hydroxylacyl-ACP dehydratase